MNSGQGKVGNAAFQDQELFTPEQVIAALEATAGIITHAAAMLKCHRTTIREYIRRYPQVEIALEDVREKMLDLTEGELIKQIKKGNMTAITFYLRTQGKARGYSDRTQVDLTGPIQVTAVDMSKVPMDDLVMAVEAQGEQGGGE